MADFGEPQVIVAAFTRASPARHAARRLLVAGPVVGACWAAALVINRAWSWPVPGAVRILVGMALLAAIGLLAAAAFGKHYRSAGCAAAAGYIGMTALDATMLIAANARRADRDQAYHAGRDSQPGPHHLHAPCTRS